MTVINNSKDPLDLTPIINAHTYDALIDAMWIRGEVIATLVCPELITEQIAFLYRDVKATSRLPEDIIDAAMRTIIHRIVYYEEFLKYSPEKCALYKATKKDQNQ